MLHFNEMTFERTESGNVYMMLRNPEAKDADPYGQHFCWTAEEWVELLAGKGTLYRDIGHVCDASLRGWLVFYDTDRIWSGATVGKFEVRYYRMEAPREALQEIDQWLRIEEERRASAPVSPSGYRDRPRVEISIACREAWLAQWGQGKGSVSLVYAGGSPDDGPVLKARLETDIARDRELNGADAGLGPRCFEAWIAMARNSTWSKADVAELRIYKDLDGYYVEAMTPKGSRIMNGGWVNHGARDSEGKPSWSSHT